MGEGKRGGTLREKKGSCALPQNKEPRSLPVFLTVCLLKKESDHRSRLTRHEVSKGGNGEGNSGQISLRGGGISCLEKNTQTNAAEPRENKYWRGGLKWKVR